MVQLLNAGGLPWPGWGTTTGKHLNWIDGGCKKSRIDGEEFERLLASEIERVNHA